MISDQDMLHALNENCFYRDTTRGTARKGMDFLSVIYNGYAKHDRSEEYIKNGLQLWWNKYGPQLGYFSFSLTALDADPIEWLYSALETMKQSQQ